MLRQLLAIFDTLDYEESGWIDLLAAGFEGKGCGLEFLVQTGVENSAPQRWAVHCLERLDFGLRGSEAHGQGSLDLHPAPHILLSPYTEPRAQLFFRGRPSDPSRTAYALYSCSRRLVDGFPAARVAGLGRALPLDQFLEFGTGVISEGPVSVLSRYAEVLQADGIQTNLLPTINPGLEYRDDVRVLTLGGSYVVGTHFDALLLPSPSTGAPRQDPASGVPARAGYPAFTIVRTPIVVPCMQVDISATVPTTVTRSPGLKPPVSPASV